VTAARGGAIACALALALAAPAAADDESEEGAPAASPSARAARARFDNGNRRYAAGDYPGAERDFLEAIRLAPELPGPWRNLGLVYVAQKRCPDALPRFQRYLALRPRSRLYARVQAEIDRCRGAGAPSAAEATTGRAATELVLVTITVSSGGRPVDGALVRVDGLARGGAPLDLQVTPGVHRVRAERAGFAAGEVTLEAAANRTAEIDVPLGPPLAAPSEAAVRRPSRRAAAWGLLGGAALAFAGGAGFGIAESANWQEATTLDRSTHVRADLDPYRSRGALYGGLAWGFDALGGAALAAAAVLFVIDVRRGEAHGEPPLARRAGRGGRFAVAPSLDARGGGLAATGSW
jgi:hypothetical protein